MMKHWLTLSLILSLSLGTFGQGTNPFEIKARVGEVLVVDSTTADHTVSPVVEQVTEIPESSELEVSQPVIMEDEVAEPEESFVVKRQQMMLNDNPFNVSHIPIRRVTKVEEEQSDAQARDSTVSEEEQESLAPRRKSTGGSKFLFWFFLIQLLLITSILGINREFFRKVNRSISNDNFAKLIGRDYNNGYDALFMITYSIFIVSFSTFIYLLARQFYGITGISRFLMILGSVLGVYFFRHFFLGFMGFVFPFRKTLTYYNFMIILFNCYLGLLLIPVNILMAYAPDTIAIIALYAGVIVIVITYLLRLLRGSLHAYTLVRNYVFHFFLYLCACEIAPILILVRFLSNSFSI